MGLKAGAYESKEKRIATRIVAIHVGALLIAWVDLVLNYMASEWGEICDDSFGRLGRVRVFAYSCCAWDGAKRTLVRGSNTVILRSVLSAVLIDSDGYAGKLNRIGHLPWWGEMTGWHLG